MLTRVSLVVIVFSRSSETKNFLTEFVFNKDFVTLKAFFLQSFLKCILKEVYIHVHHSALCNSFRCQQIEINRLINAGIRGGIIYFLISNFHSQVILSRNTSLFLWAC